MGHFHYAKMWHRCHQNLPCIIQTFMTHDESREIIADFEANCEAYDQLMLYIAYVKNGEVGPRPNQGYYDYLYTIIQKRSLFASAFVVPIEIELYRRNGLAVPEELLNDHVEDIAIVSSSVKDGAPMRCYLTGTQAASIVSQISRVMSSRDKSRRGGDFDPEYILLAEKIIAKHTCYPDLFSRTVLEIAFNESRGEEV